MVRFGIVNDPVATDRTGSSLQIALTIISMRCHRSHPIPNVCGFFVTYTRKRQRPFTSRWSA